MRALTRRASLSSLAAALVALASLGLGVAALLPRLDRAWTAQRLEARLARAAAHSGRGVPAPADLGVALTGGTPRALASWQTIGGCGAGAGGGGGVGVKWIGRNVTGGLFHVENQTNYIETTYGHDYVSTTLISHDLGEKWNLGVSIPYVYKFINDPYGLKVDVANKGPGDVSLMLTRRFGAINDTTAMLIVGAPTATHEAKFRNTQTLAQQWQLGMGKPVGSLVIDHIIDNLWGPIVIGGLVGYRGGENELHNYRAPTGSLYSYASYLIGPFAPALGVAATGWKAHDVDQEQGEQKGTPLASFALNASLEWAGDWAALLFGVSLPYQYDGETVDANGRAKSPWSFAGITAGVGLALAPF